jgi:hypothetical protein
VIAGRLIDSIGNAVPDALVRHRDWYAFTDSDGSYAITVPQELTASSVTPDTVRVTKAGWTFVAPAFDNSAAPIVLPGPAMTNVDFRGSYGG